MVVPDQKFAVGDRNQFAFYSTYQTFDLVCYPSEHEGSGNQAMETIWARLPLVVLEYPVFKVFLRQHIPNYVSLGDVAGLLRPVSLRGLYQLPEEALGRALQQAITVLKDTP